MKTNILLKLTMLAALAIFVMLTACKEDEEDDTNTAPTIEITNPLDGQFIEKGDDVTVTINAADIDNNLEEVIIYLNDNVVKTFNEGPFEYTFSTQIAAYGEHIIKAEAIDSKLANTEDFVTFSLATTPVAGFTANRTAGLTGRIIDFTDQSGYDPLEWLWDFGDGNTSVEQNPAHIYTQAGTYTVSLTVTNNVGTNTITKTDFITIYPIDMIELVNVEGGTFEMGSDSDYENDNPVHSVTLSSYYIGKYEVTNEQYADFLNAIEANANGIHNGRQYIYITDNQCFINHDGAEFYVETGKENYPVGVLSWYGAKAFADYYGYRLPTEAQWEYAARGGQNEIDTRFSGSNSLDEVAWHSLNSNGYSEVGLKAANELGIHDMSGNVLEWCQDWYSDSYYLNSPVHNPGGPSQSNSVYFKVARGGSVLFGNPYYICTVSYRFDQTPASAYDPNGFRVALPNE